MDIELTLKDTSSKRLRKIENFIRTKYESRRWVMDGPMPDPETLDAEGDDDVVCPYTVTLW